MPKIIIIGNTSSLINGAVLLPLAAQGYQDSYRQLMYDNRTIWKANYALDVVAFRGVTITPWTKYQDTNYGVDPFLQQGLQDSKSWNFGVDGTYAINPDLSVMAGYTTAYATQVLFGTTSTTASVVPAGTPQTTTNDRSLVNTFTAAVNYAAIPNKLDTELRYTAQHAVDYMTLEEPVVDIATVCTTRDDITTCSDNGQFPENKTWFQRLDATAVYKFDPETVAAFGWKGDVKVKLNYAWEMNSQTNWANDPLSPTLPATCSLGTASCQDLWLGWYNPNYDVQMITASLIASW